VPDAAQRATQHDLLEEPAFRVRFGDGRRAELTLPGLLAAMGASEGPDLESFTGLQAHQQHAWHAFLVQLAAITLHRADTTSATLSEDAWRQRLLALTAGAHEPWCLVVGDLAKPAFMQPPVPEGTVGGFSQDRPGVANNDVLATAKNHDVKASRIARPRTEHWVFALVTLQTMEGYTGAKNYGIARMNKGSSSRPCVAYSPVADGAARFREDLRRLLAGRDSVAEDFGLKESGGLALLWLEAWDGERKLRFRDCDPCFIEICRRVRLVIDAGSVCARYRSTSCQRLDAEDLLGRTGDPWTPLSTKEAKSLTITEAGFGYRLVVDLVLSGAYRGGLALEPLGGKESAWLICRAMARGNCVTNGLHERVILLPGKVRNALSRADLRTALAEQAKARVERASSVQNEVLRPALKVLLQGAPDKLKFEDHRPRRWTQAFNRAVDDVFIPALFADVGKPSDEANRAFDQRLFDLARVQLEAAIAGAPVPIARRPRAIAAAEREFRGRARRTLPNLFPSEPETGSPTEA